MRGETTPGNESLGIILAAHPQEKHYFARPAFAGSCVETYLGKKWVWQIPKIVKERKSDHSLLIVTVPHILHMVSHAPRCFYVPCWIWGEIDIPTKRSIIVKNKNTSLKSDISKIRKNNLEFEVTHQLSQLHNFYYNMYVPYISQSHGDRSYFRDYRFVETEFSKQGFFKDLLLVKKQEEYIAGVLLRYQDKTAELSILGIKDGNSNYVRDGAIGALFYFSVCYAAQKGFRKITFGESRPFLKDGVLRYKKKWNQRLTRERKPGFLIKALSKTGGVKGFFLNNPFIYKNKAGYYGAIFVVSGHSLSKEVCTKIYKDYFIPGLTKLVIYQFGSVNAETQDIVYPEYAEKITVRSADSIFCNV